ncbi:ATR-interacting protein mus304 isoform X2 [Hermetia illucens]|uniref:ATR-interacting protein mus304 isoform X2 n=1 Tax=Hermetia illucens TaxID=343691 RepID=UPI0018CBF7F8|nr:ATR-interacting protein mus304 isoform X2 [Hermetia illucens]
MAKRFSHFQPNSFASKKPKLDISFGKPDGGAGSSKSRHVPRTASLINGSSENLFDDGDDDVILLASQNVEAEHNREQFSQQIFIDESLSEISFSKFARELPTSTQRITTLRDKVDPPKTSVNDAFDNIEKYFEDEIEIQMKEIDERENFKAPQPVKRDPPVNELSGNPMLDTRKSMKERDGLISQVNYFTEKTAAYKEQIEKLKKEVSEFNDKIQTKDGEVSMVRYQLRQLQQQNEALRLEKMQEIDNIKKEWQEKINELDKLIKSQRDELEFKNVEIVNLKSSRLNESQRNFEYAELRKNFQNVPFLHNLHLDLTRKSGRAREEIPKELFERSLVRDEKLKFRDSLFQRELENMQSGLSHMRIMEREHLEMNNPVSKQIIMSLKNSIKALLSYARKLEFMKFIETNASVEYRFLCEEPPDRPSCAIHERNENIFQEKKLYSMEKAEIARRLVGGFAIACKYSIAVWKSLLTERVNNITLLETLSEIVNLLGFSKELYTHFGLLESLEYLLLSFVQNCTESETSAALISQFLRHLVFCRPGYRPLVPISECLVYISVKFTSSPVLDSLCNDSPLGSFVFNEYYKIFQFSPRSCMLQVYGALLETAFAQDVVLSRIQVDCLQKICRNHIIFLSSCFERNVKWILRPQSSSKDCDCYVKAINSAVILIHLVLKQWTSDPKSIDIRVVADMSRSGVLLLCSAFYKNYRRDVLQNGGSSVKHRLHMIHDWLNEYKSVFQFKSAHCYALQSIKLAHIIADPIRMDETSIGDSLEQGDAIWSEVFENFV